jgi:hypothetical protein
MQIPVNNNMGGNINQDISKALLKPDFVYDSHNYRVITIGGAANLSRTNLKGNTRVSQVDDIPSTTKIELNEDFLFNLTIASTYSMTIEIDGVALPLFTFTYVDADTLLQEITDFINVTYPTVATFFLGTPSYIIVATTATTTVLISGLTYVSGGTGLVSYNPYIAIPGAIQPLLYTSNWTQASTGTVGVGGILSTQQPLNVTKSGISVPVRETSVTNGVASTHTLTQTLPFTLQPGTYKFNYKYWAGAIQNTTVQTSVSIGGITIAYPVASGADYSNIGTGAYRTFTSVIAPASNDIVVSLTTIPSAAGAPPPTCTATVYLYQLELFGPGLYDDVFTVTNDYTDGIAGLQIIGWVSLRDDIYLFTTNSSDADPGGADPASYGQIWKFSYTKNTLAGFSTIYTLDLVYNNILNFSTAHPIFNPGRVEARYENPEIQKIYWTDYFNPPRYINVADPNVASLTPEQLLLNPSINFDIPVINNIIKGGNLRTGMYQYAYRLKRQNGSETRFSMPSGLTFLNVYDEGTTRWFDYFANDAGLTVDKTIEIKIDNIDTTFEFIEFAFIYYGTKNTAPEVKIFKSEVVNNRTSIIVRHTGEEDSDFPISLDELTAFQTNIVRAKALATKNNTLFLSNVKVNTYDPDYDSRAYRFPLNLTTTNIRNGSSVYTIDSATWNITIIDGIAVTPFPVPEEFDAIQDYDSQAPFSTNNNLYKPNSASASTLTNIGGAGPNISYEFVDYDILGDEKFTGTSPSAGSYMNVPYRVITSKTNNIISLGDRDRSNGNFFDCFISPFYAPSMAGYQRDEMYRYAIVFFDRLGNPSFAKWIADIRIPHIYMPNGVFKHERFLAYPLVEHDSTLKKTYTKQMYIKFTVNNVPDDATGFQIVVVPREETDKHIVGQGVFSFAQKDYSSPISPYAFYLSHDSAIGNGGNRYFPVNLREATEVWPNVGSIKSPDFDFRGFPGYQLGDNIDFVAILNNSEHVYVYGSTDEQEMNGDSATIDVAWTMQKAYLHVDTSGVNARPNCIKDAAADGPIYTVHSSFEVEKNSGYNSYAPASLLVYSPIARLANYSPVNTNSGAFVTRTSVGPKRVALIFGGVAPYSGVVGGSSDWLDISYSGREYPSKDGWISGAGGQSQFKYIVNYKRTLNAQYNGNTYANRSTNIYRAATNFIKVTPGTTTYADMVIAGGDTYTQIYDTIAEFPDWGRRGGGSYKPYMDPSGISIADNSQGLQTAAMTWLVPLESTINTELRGEEVSPLQIPNSVDPPASDIAGTLDRDESFETTDSDLYSWNPYYMSFVPKNLTYSNISEFDVRTYKTNEKTNSESVDSWTVIKPDAFLDVESKYGPINNLIVFKDRLFYFQDRGFGVFQVNAQQLVQDPTSTSELVLGTSGILNRYDYISSIVGSKTQSGFAVSDNTLFFVDIMSRKVYTYNGEGALPLSDIKGLSSFLYNKLGGDVQITDNPVQDIGLTATYDYTHNEFLLTMLDLDIDDRNRFLVTLAYNELTQGFTSFYSYHPKMYINDKLNIFTVPAGLNMGNRIFVNNAGSYGVFYEQPPVPSKLSFLVNHESSQEKILTNFEFVTESYSETIQLGYNFPFQDKVANDFLSRIRVSNTYQNTDYINTTEIAKKRKTLWNVKVPGNRVLYNNANIISIYDPLNISPTRLRLTQRLKDRWFLVDTEYDNTPNYKFIITNCTSLLMLNTR